MGCAATFGACTESAPVGAERLPVVFLGQFSAEADPLYGFWLRRMQRRHPAIALGLRSRYHHVHVDDPAATDRDVKAAFREPARLIIATSGTVAEAAARHHGDTPVVFASQEHPLRSGIVDGMSRRTRAITGVTMVDELHDKRLSLLREALPRARRLGVLMERGYATADGNHRRIMLAAEASGWSATPVLAERPEDVAVALHARRVRQFDAWYIPPLYVAFLASANIVAALNAGQRPAMHTTVAEVRQGGWMAYAQDNDFATLALIELAARVCGGEDPSRIPIQRAHRFMLAVRPRAGGALPTIPRALVQRADVVA